MRLNKIKLMNFRCFGDVETIIRVNEVSVFIGANSSGKTTIFEAIKKVLGSSTADRIIKRSDFHLKKNDKPEEITQMMLYIELIFSFEELIEAEGNFDSVPIFFRHFIVDNPGGTPYIRVRLTAEWRKSLNIEGSIDSRIEYITCSEKHEIKNENVTLAYRKDIDSIRLIVVPAIRDVEKQVRIVSGSILKRLVDLIDFDEDSKKVIAEKSKNMNDYLLSDTELKKINSSLSNNWKNFNSDNRFTESHLNFAGTDILDIVKHLEIGFSPSVLERDFLVEELGDGSKSLFYFTMISAMLELENIVIAGGKSDQKQLPIHTIFIAEEPENNIAPHVLGQLINEIFRVSNMHNCQALISSHSESIISRIDPADIRLVYNDIDTYSSRVCQIDFSFMTDKEIIKYIKNVIQKHSHFYFSKLVIVVEGETEKIIIPRILAAKNIDMESKQISIVTMDSRFIEFFWKLLSNLQIPYVTLLDFDAHRFHGDSKIIAYVCEQLRAIQKFDEIDVGEKKLFFKDKINLQFKEEVFHINDLEVLNGWQEFLKQYDVFFASPLDMDFLMLEHYKDKYLRTLNPTEGPIVIGLGKIINIEIEDPTDNRYINRVNDAVNQTLKSDRGDASIYNEEQKKLLVWYVYFFLNNSKPTSHYLALAKMTDEEILSNLPKVFDDLISAVSEKLVDKHGEK